jgi:succinate dehydrogenase/fumarate reductase flavoprotein subunit
MADLEADVVIVGYGGAGGAAALAAQEAGAKVIVLEKNAEGGGNTRYSGGSMRTYLDVEKSCDYIESLCDGATERDVIKAFVLEAGRNPEWLKTMGAQIVDRGLPKRFPISAPVAYPTTRGADGIGPRVRVKGATESGGIDIWGILSRHVAEKRIEVICSAPVKKLLREKERGVTGVIATRGEQDVTVKAKRAVILTCGGFEYDDGMHINYLGQRYYGLCNPGNTGDGIRLAGDIGADLWHMNGVAGTLGYKFPEFPCGIRQFISSAGYIYVDQLGSRFVDEPGTDSHLMWAPSSYIDTKTLARLRIPCYAIFDEDTRMRGPVAETGRGKISDLYQWSPDNSAEVKKGWIRAAQTVGELAAMIGVRPDLLQSTVAKYNIQCVGGYDPEYGRAGDTLVPIARPPYYAVEMWPCLFNTQGGPKRNAKAQVLDVWGQPIPRLYSAGELGSLWHRNYPGAGNVSEALAVGRIAGRNAAAERPHTA